jgi:hypothetical protein
MAMPENPSSSRVDRRRVGVDDAHGSPGGEARRQLANARAVCGQERLGLVRRQRLDADRAGRCDQRGLEPVALHHGGAGERVVADGVDQVVGLALELQQPAAVVPAHARALGARREGGQERLGPQVLVNVDAPHRRPH